MLSLSDHSLRQLVLSCDLTLKSYGLILQLQIHEQLNNYTVQIVIQTKQAPDMMQRTEKSFCLIYLPS